MTQIIAHRGGAALWPENSWTAIRGACELGVDGVEVDIHQTRDGWLVVHHDPSLERMTDRPLVIGDSDIAAILDAPIRSAEGDTGDVGASPLLGNVTGYLAAQGVLASIEIKWRPGYVPYDGLEDRLCQLLRGGPDGAERLVHSFDWHALKRVRAVDSTIRLAANIAFEQVSKHGSLTKVIEKASSFGFNHVNIDHRLVDDDAFDRTVDAGLTVSMWTVNKDEDIERWLGRGLFGIATDRPDRALRLRSELES